MSNLDLACRVVTPLACGTGAFRPFDGELEPDCRNPK
jgi:hypothetical protein